MEEQSLIDQFKEAGRKVRQKYTSAGEAWKGELENMKRLVEGKPLKTWEVFALQEAFTDAFELLWRQADAMVRDADAQLSLVVVATLRGLGDERNVDAAAIR